MPKSAGAHAATRGRRRLLPALACAAMLCGCATPSLQDARESFLRGDPEAAARALRDIPPRDKDRTLYLMERGMARQCIGDYDGSIADWLEAVALIDDLDAYSVSRGAGSWLINDRTLSYRGTPHERVLLRSSLALNFLAKGAWEDAAVEARNAIDGLEGLPAGLPDDAFSRYLAGFCLEMAGERESATVQYRVASDLVGPGRIDARTGRVAAASGGPRRDAGPGGDAATRELVCFLAMGRLLAPWRHDASAHAKQPAPAADLSADGVTLGAGVMLTDADALFRRAEEARAAGRAAKTVARIGVKEVAVQALRQQDELLGQLLEILLIGAEQPDTRRWESLPRWWGVARVACPANMAAFTVRFRDASGRVYMERSMERPSAGDGRVLVSLCRDLPQRTAGARAPTASPAGTPRPAAR